MHSKLKNINFKTTLIKTLFCLCFFSFGVTSVISLYSYNQFDPSFFTVNDDSPSNVMGHYGANLSAILFIVFGDAS